MNVDEGHFSKIVSESYYKSEVAEKIGLPHCNGKVTKEIDFLVAKLNLDISHFKNGGAKNRKYKDIIKQCPVCGKEFSTKLGHPREKETCSYACSNTYFRTGPENGNWSDESYRSTCFHYHDKKCIICGEENIVDVHHYDENHNNNSPENLIPLCPTHHKYLHSRYKHLIENDVDRYREEFKIKNKRMNMTKIVIPEADIDIEVNSEDIKDIDEKTKEVVLPLLSLKARQAQNGYIEKDGNIRRFFTKSCDLNFESNKITLLLHMDVQSK